MAYKRNQKYPWKPAPTPTVHNQHKPFNPGRHGKVWGSIRFEHDWGKSPVGDSQGEVIGKLFIGDRYNEITHAEATRIIDTLRDGLHAHKVGMRLGRTNQHAGIKDSAKYL